LRLLGDQRSLELARYIVRRGIRRCEALFEDAARAPDARGYQLARSLLEPGDNES
jgi:hypothetical protein